ncbi:MAG: DUF4446 family protein [Candidatus Levybacteria bacterium]|nr:DUF4446 family protein [Candidatus Levybacteria bacterium]
MLSTVGLIAILLIVAWLSALSYLFWKLHTKYLIFEENGEQKSLPSLLEALTKELSLSKKHIAELSKRCDKIEEEGKFHIQKIGLLRFNPFKDTGGDQSFIVALIDANDTGIVISGLYSRSGTRWYAKKIVAGKGSDHELSDEEKKALKLATHIGNE